MPSELLLNAPVRNRHASAAGLAIAWGGTALLTSPPALALEADGNLAVAIVGQLAFWLIGGAVLFILLRWERQPLRSIWLRPFAWESIGWGLALVAVNHFILFPAGEWVRRASGLPGFAAGMEQIMVYPVWFRALAVLGAGVVEEVLFRGYSVTRLAAFTGRVWVAGALVLVAFCLLHVPVWGWGFALGGLVSGAGAMAFFIWRRDLLAMIVFHTITDALGLVILPSFSEWWKDPALM